MIVRDHCARSSEIDRCCCCVRRYHTRILYCTRMLHNVRVYAYGMTVPYTYGMAMDLFHNDVKNKNGGYCVGTLYGRPTERLVFRYDRHGEITKYIQIRNI